MPPVEFLVIAGLCAVVVGLLFRVSYLELMSVFLFVTAPALFVLGSAVIMTRSGCISGLNDFPFLEKLHPILPATLLFAGILLAILAGFQKRSRTKTAFANSHSPLP